MLSVCMSACKAKKSQSSNLNADSASESGQKAKSSGLRGMGMPKGNKSRWSRCCEAFRGYMKQPHSIREQGVDRTSLVNQNWSGLEVVDSELVFFFENGFVGRGPVTLNWTDATASAMKARTEALTVVGMAFLPV